MDAAEDGEEELADGAEGDEAEQLRELQDGDLAVGQRGDAGVLLGADEEVAGEGAGEVGGRDGLPRSESLEAALAVGLRTGRTRTSVRAPRAAASAGWTMEAKNWLPEATHSKGLATEATACSA